MINTKKIIAVVALCMTSVASFAEGKIAVLNPEGAMLSTNYAKARFEKLEKSSDFTSTKAKLDGIVADIKGLQAAYQKEGQTWPTEKKEENERKLQSLSQDYQINLKRLQDSQQAVMQQIQQELQPKFTAAAKLVVEAEKIGLLINSQATMIASAEYDISSKVTDLINKASEQPAAAAPAKAK